MNFEGKFFLSRFVDYGSSMEGRLWMYVVYFTSQLDILSLFKINENIV